MLVLSRRTNETIVFPALDAIIEVLQVKGAVARIGIRAPRDLEVLRGELYSRTKQLQESAIAREQREFEREKERRREVHELRNSLNSATIGLSLLKRQIEAGFYEDARDTLQTILADVHKTSDSKPEPVAPRSPKALLVEDNANERKLLAGYLKANGFAVDTANDGEEAIQYLSDVPTRPDVVLMDMVMPRCDGRTAIRTIRTDPRNEGVHIFAVSGVEPQKLGFDKDNREVDFWFRKPLDPEHLVGELSRVVSDVA